MAEEKIRFFNVVDNKPLPEISSGHVFLEGDPVEINGEMYYVCEVRGSQEDGSREMGLIPLVVRDPLKLKNINSYISCLKTAKRRLEFRKDHNICESDECDEMIIK